MSKRRRAWPYIYQFSPRQFAGLVLWLRADLGVTIVPSALAATGTTPPAVSLTGTIAAHQSQTALATPWIEIDIKVTGVLGASQFQWSLNGIVQATSIPTQATFALGSTGIVANFPAGTYTNDNVYKANINLSALADQSGQGNNVIQAASSQQPIYLATGGHQGAPALSLAGSANQALVNTTATPVTGTNATLFMVSKNTGTLSTSAIRLLLGSTQAGNSISMQDTAGSRQLVAAGAASMSDGAETSNWEAWTWVTGGGANTFDVNGVSQAISGSTTVIQAPNADITIGNLAAGGAGFTGLIDEVIVYNNRLVPTQYAAVEQYIRSRTEIW